MKRIYEKPEIELVKFESEPIATMAVDEGGSAGDGPSNAGDGVVPWPVQD